MKNLENDNAASAQARWANLSRLLNERHTKAWDRRTTMMWFAEFLARELQEYIGMPIECDGRNGVKPISFHTFIAGVPPTPDTYAPKDHAFDAIGYDDDGFFTFGLGIQLELGPRTTPRQNFVLGVRVKPSSDGWECTTTFPNFGKLMLKERIDRNDLHRMAEAIYRHLALWLEKQAKIFDSNSGDSVVETFPMIQLD